MSTDKPKEYGNRPLPIQDPSGILGPDVCWEYRILDGFWLSMLDIKPQEDISLKFEKESPILNFGFILSGAYTNCIKAPGLGKIGFSNQAGGSGILYVPRQDVRLVIPAQPRVRILHIHLSPSAFHHLFHPDRNTLPHGLKPLLDGPSNQSFSFKTGMSVDVRSALQRLIDGPTPGTPARLFYQGIALELLAGQISRANNVPNSLPGMCSDERDQLLKARKLLTRDLTSPPCLKQLARHTGLNMNKLQQGFHRLYGASVFQYLQSYRMQEANRLFHETDMNVSQAAFAVGYTNVSHFSRAYKKHFNILPKKHLACIKG